MMDDKVNAIANTAIQDAIYYHTQNDDELQWGDMSRIMRIRLTHSFIISAAEKILGSNGKLSIEELKEIDYTISKYIWY